MLANSYPLADIFVTMLEFFLFFAWIWILIIVFGDIFRSRDLSGWGKALWILFVIIIPWVGVLVYLIARGGKMHQRQLEAAQAQDQAFRQYVQEAAATSADGSAGELAKLADLRDRGVISEAEFQQQKAKALGS
ncbi:MAG TPA: SHOCT domain-containing protein [Acidimicrobiales bacterium]|nr:SHOCT domain-containing protein [Acidimicrobiales bacterium]